MYVHFGSTKISLLRYLALCSAVVVIFAMQGYLNDLSLGHTWEAWDYLRWSIIQWGIWAALAPWVFRLAARHPIRAPVRVQSFIKQLFNSMAMALLAIFVGAFISAFFEPTSFFNQLWQFATKRYTGGVLTFWALVALQHGMQAYAEQSQRELELSRLSEELAQSRLQVLKTQLQPHFLFNTLHAVATLLHEDTLAAEGMLLRLSDLLRAFLEDHDGEEVSLRRELVLLDLYLGIQRTRFKDRLTTQIYVAPDTLDCAVPSLILQPIVENAITHGIGQRIGSDCVEIETRREGDRLCIDVRNRNSTLEQGALANARASSASGHGIGLSNTALRLRELYGEAGDVRLEMIWPQGVVCRLRLPFRQIEEADDVPEVMSA